ncbi:MAG: dTDP-4-dehydrorhamnose 3,5-epimerase [Clostridiales bacterium]|jgi:dTDP-4-dehydrorhamnose 3,5-epimerase|nr:dTDP-4-dehydrorhamnose 3,5-epimerase [Clostridiales bacterium]
MVTVKNFIFHSTKIDGVIVVQPKVFADERGFFMETYQKQIFCEGGIEANFVQDNHSMSTKGVLRGLHLQKKCPQAKLVRVIKGEVFDVAVDLRKGSKTFGQWVGEYLSCENKKQLFIPKGFAHGFFILSDSAEFVYKCDEYYDKDDEYGIIWNDKCIGIDWPLCNQKPILSNKDLLWRDLDSFVNTKF